MVFDGVWLALLGVLAVPGLVRGSQAKMLLVVVTPFQGFFGVASFLKGAWGVLGLLARVGLVRTVPWLWTSWLAAHVVLVTLGFLVGCNTARVFLTDEGVRKKMDATLAFLSPHRQQLGHIAIGTGLWAIIAALVWPLP